MCLGSAKRRIHEKGVPVREYRFRKGNGKSRGIKELKWGEELLFKA